MPPASSIGIVKITAQPQSLFHEPKTNAKNAVKQFHKKNPSNINMTFRFILRGRMPLSHCQSLYHTVFFSTLLFFTCRAKDSTISGKSNSVISAAGVRDSVGSEAVLTTCLGLLMRHFVHPLLF